MSPVYIRAGNLRAGRYGGPVPTLPTHSAMVANWDAAVGITLNGSDVSNWADPIGGHDFAQASAPDQPVYNPVQINGYPTVQCNSGEFMEAADHADLNVGVGSWLIMAVLNRPQLVAYSCFLGKGVSDNIRVFFQPNQDTLSTYYSAFNYPRPALPVPDGQDMLIGWGVDAVSNEAIYITDGVIERKSTTIYGTGSNATPLRLHGDPDGIYDTDTWAAAEMVFYKGRVLDSEIEDARDNYFSIKYGL